LVRAGDQLEARKQLEAGLKRVKDGFRFGGCFDRCVGDIVARPFQFFRRHLFAQWHHQDINEILAQRGFEVGSPSPVGETGTAEERRVFQKPRLNEIRMGDADVLKGRLKLAIVGDGERVYYDRKYF